MLNSTVTSVDNIDHISTSLNVAHTEKHTLHQFYMSPYTTEL